MRFRTTTAAVLLLLTVAASAFAVDTIDNLKVGNMTLNFNPQDGFKLDYKGATVITESGLHAAKPGWLAVYYSYESGEKNIETKDIPGGKEIIVHHIGTSFDGDHHIKMLSDKITFDLRYKLTADVPEPGIEYTVGYFSAPLINGCPWRAETASGSEFGIVPLKPLSTESEIGLTPHPFKKIEFESRVGKLTIETNGNPNDLTLIDWRGMRTPWAARNPIFLLSAPRTALKKGDERHSVVSFTFNPLEKKVSQVTGQAAATSMVDVPDVRKTTPRPIVVIPQPKEIQPLNGDFVLNGKTMIVVGKSAADEDMRGAKSFASEIYSTYRMNIPIVREGDAASANVILIGESASNAALANAAREEGISAPDNNEGYALKVTPNRVIVLGHDRRGSYYGIQTLKQLVKASVDNISVQGCAINDYPSLGYRGLYIYTGIDALPFHKKMIDRILARYKMNKLIVCADQIHWKSAPETAPNDAMTQEDLKKDIAYANEHFIEVNPEISALCHANWIFCTGHHKDLAEDPEHTFAYCPSNKESYDFIFKILDETVDLFNHPKYVHIGHDELNSPTSEFPHDEACKKRGLGNIFLDDTVKIYDYLKAKEVGTMIWGDMLLSPGSSPDACNMPDPKEAERLRKALPKDIVITDWHYDMSNPKEFHSLRIFHDAGFLTIASTWYTPANIQNFSQAAKDNNSMGLLQTTWAGWNSNERDLYGPFKDQFTAIVLAAEYAWNSGNTRLEKLPYDAEDVFFREWNRGIAKRECSKGFTVDLKPVYNAPLANKQDARLWVGLGPDTDLSSTPVGDVRLQDDLFTLSKNTAENSAVRLQSALDGTAPFPSHIEIPIGRSAGSLLFLHASAYSDMPGRVVGSYRINYEDGNSEEISLVYRKNITAWTDASPCTDAVIAWQTDSPDGQRISLREMEWKNTHPDVKIKSIEITSSGTDGAPVLIGLSGISVK